MEGKVAGYGIGEVRRIIDKSWSLWRRKYAAAPGVEERPGPDAHTVITGLDLSNVNAVLEAALAPEGLEKRIREITAPFRRRSVGLTWWVGPCSQPENLDRALLEAGFEEGRVLIGMAADLAQTDLREDGPGAELVRISDPEALKEYCRATAQAYEVSPPGLELALAAFNRLDYGPGARLAHFAARLSGRLAATASIAVEKDWALLAGVGTVPQARGRGLGTAVTVRALQEARSKGCGLAVLQASTAGEPIYRKLGFREYCRLRRFKWTPDREGQVRPE